MKESQPQQQQQTTTATTTIQVATPTAATATTTATTTNILRIVLPHRPDDFHFHARDGLQTAAVLRHVQHRLGRCLFMPNLKPPLTTVERVLQYRDHVLQSIQANNDSNSNIVHTEEEVVNDDNQEDSSTTGVVVVAAAAAAASSTSSSSSSFQPLFSLYLTDFTTPDEIQKAHDVNMEYHKKKKSNRLQQEQQDENIDELSSCHDKIIIAAKYYPAGATTHSEYGVTHPKILYPVFEKMQQVGMRLCLHCEVTYGDIFDRETTFLQTIVQPLLQDFPNLYMTIEHISTRHAVEFVLQAPDTVKASITCHHLLYNRNDLLVGGIHPHLYCLPILKSEEDRRALLEAATSGNPKFFAGTDSAPHSTHAKESACGCAGIFTAHASIELYAEAFDSFLQQNEPHDDAANNMQQLLSNFLCVHGAQHYGLIPPSSSLQPSNEQQQQQQPVMILEKKPWRVPRTYDFGGNGMTVTPLRAGEIIPWSLTVAPPPVEQPTTKNAQEE